MPFFQSHSQLSRGEIKKDLWQITSLDQKQKAIVEEVLKKYKKEGPLERWEFSHALKELKNKRIELGLSEIDIENIENYFLAEEK